MQAMGRLAFLIICGLGGAAILASLGVWQVQRLSWKEGKLQKIEESLAAVPVALPSKPDEKRDAYLAVVVSGTILPGELHVLHSVKGAGVGYRIISPFRTDDGRKIILDRGFVRSTAKDAVRDLGPVTVTGNLLWPDEADRYTPQADTTANTWYVREVAALSLALDTEPVLLVAATPTGTAIKPLPVGTGHIPNNHLQYAITWFSLALIWVGMTLFFLRRTRADKHG